MKNSPFHNNTRISLLALFSLALFLRFYEINKFDFWFDECVSNTYSAQGLKAMTGVSGLPIIPIILNHMKCDPHSPLYYFLVYGYSFFFGNGLSLRFLSVFFSFLSLIIFYRLSRLFFNPSASLYALLFLAIHPFHIWYAQEARGYAAICFLGLLTIYIYVQA